MSVRSEAKSVSTTATLLAGYVAATYTDTGGMSHTRRDVALHNSGTATVYLGGSDVDTTDGYPLDAGEHLTVPEMAQWDLLYGIVASGTQSVVVMEIGV